jgi:hypothetical protein
MKIAGWVVIGTLITAAAFILINFLVQYLWNGMMGIFDAPYTVNYRESWFITLSLTLLGVCFAPKRLKMD